MVTREEMDAVHAAVFQMRQEIADWKRDSAVSAEEVEKRLIWYAELERLAIEVGHYVRTGDDGPLRELWDEVRQLHRFISPAVPREKMPRPA